MKQRRSKIILLGAEGYHLTDEKVTVECIPWHQISNLENVRDYDVVILNLLGLKDKVIRDEIRWRAFCEQLSFEATMDIICHGGAIIVIGDPRLRTTITDARTGYPRPFLSWTGRTFKWDDGPGDTVLLTAQDTESKFRPYTDRIKKWQYSLRECSLDMTQINSYFNRSHLKQFPDGCKLEMRNDNLCQNRYGNAIAFSLYFDIFAKQFNGVTDVRKCLNSYGPIVFLPEIGLPEDETIQLLLRDVLAVQISLPEPEWIKFLCPLGKRT